MNQSRPSAAGSASPPAQIHQFTTSGGIRVFRWSRPVALEDGVEDVIAGLDSRRGVVLTSGFEYPGRYTRWDIGFTDPPLVVEASGRDFTISTLNARGQVLIAPVWARLAALPDLERLDSPPGRVTGRVAEPAGTLDEEQRTRRPTVFTVLRTLVDLFRSPEDGHLGLYGAFGYDLAFQFEPLEARLPRSPGSRDLVLYLPDRLTVIDHAARIATRHEYEFETATGTTTAGIPVEPVAAPFLPAAGGAPSRDHQPGEFARLVEAAKRAFARGDLFEVVPGQSFSEPLARPPSAVFRHLRRHNPAPYGAFMNLGAGEYLVAASPEMYVRVSGRRVETCPISGTIARGDDVITDAEQIRRLLNSDKDASELTMCTDVDRNDKARVCVPGSVRVVGRRQIEMYSRVIHTVDHVEGILRDGFDAIDAFLTHAWAVTVTGAPKLWAMRFIEAHERSPRGWYGGAIGWIGFDGGLNTGLTLRTVHVHDGIATVRAGATLLADSVPADEERETELKASALLEAIRGEIRTGQEARVASQVGFGRRVLLIDHEDSFVHTLADYLRQTGAEVTTVRTPAPSELRKRLEWMRPDLVVLSPGPGRPEDFATGATLSVLLEMGVSVFGVCLGLQAIVEHLGGELGVLDPPVHGKQSELRVTGGRLFRGLPERFEVGRYHSLHALAGSLPGELEITARSEDGVVMAIEHRSLPVAAVQFHPESIMTAHGGAGLRILENVMAMAAGEAEPAAV